MIRNRSAPLVLLLGAAIALQGCANARDHYEDGDEIDGVNGWEKYVDWHAAIPILMKAETDTTDARRQLAMIEAEIRAHAPKRDRGRPEVIQDTAQDDWAGIGIGYRNRLVRE